DPRRCPAIDQQNESFPTSGKLLPKPIGLIEMVAGETGKAVMDADDFHEVTTATSAGSAPEGTDRPAILLLSNAAAIRELHTGDWFSMPQPPVNGIRELPANMRLFENVGEIIQLALDRSPLALDVRARAMGTQDAVDVPAGVNRRADIPARAIIVVVAVPRIADSIQRPLQPYGAAVQIVFAVPFAAPRMIDRAPEVVRSLFAVPDHARDALTAIIAAAIAAAIAIAILRVGNHR
ncbi:MAG TPA: hypothetical protein VF713_00245, partial [Thermoanaerobaculia bacterium]